jgi:hypothetical protein
MSWHEASGGQGGAGAVAVAVFLTKSVHDEVDGAQVGEVTVLSREAQPGPHTALYALAVVRGPLRSYVATAWGPAGHPSGKRIVSYPTPQEAQAAFDVLVAQRTAHGGSQAGYRVAGTYTPP